jgi:hypothetical protein
VSENNFIKIRIEFCAINLVRLSPVRCTDKSTDVATLNNSLTPTLLIVKAKKTANSPLQLRQDPIKFTLPLVIIASGQIFKAAVLSESIK